MEFRPIPEATPRKAMTVKRKLAACLAHMRHPEDSSLPLVPNADRMTDDEIIATVAFDHTIPLALGGKDEAHNIQPYPTRDHQAVKTPRDQKMIAKARRSRNSEEAFRARLLAKTTGDDAPRDIRKRRIPSRGFPKKRSVPA